MTRCRPRPHGSVAGTTREAMRILFVGSTVRILAFRPVAAVSSQPKPASPGVSDPNLSFKTRPTKTASGRDTSNHARQKYRMSCTSAFSSLVVQEPEIADAYFAHATHGSCLRGV